MTDKVELLCWNDMSEEDKADFFSKEPFKIVEHDRQREKDFDFNC